MITKTYLYDIIVGNFYRFKVYKIVDGIGQTFYTASPVSHGGTVIADTEKEIKPLLEKQVKPLNDFLAKTK